MARRLTLDFLRTESGSGLVLALAALAAVIAANSPWAWRYFAFIAQPIPVRFGAFAETLTLAQWVREALMPVAFLVVGMQIKFEVLRGELASWRRLGLPLAAAAGGLVVPALAFLAIADPGEAPGAWAAAMATDLPLALALLTLAGPRLPPALRILLLTVAMADNVAAVAGIALGYGHVDHPGALAGAGIGVALLAVMGWWRRAPFLFYAAGFVIVWSLVLKSGLNTALAGVACGFTVPIGARRPGQDSVLAYFLGSLHPYVAYGVLPLFAFTAAGFAFAGHAPERLVSPLALALGAGLALAKPAGVFTFALAAAVTRLGRRPPGVTWAELGGVALLSGVGFSISLFVGELSAGENTMTEARVRLAVIAGSLLAAAAGAALLAWAQSQRTARGEDVR
jgi:NhaA family Na+:H+ antiporter